MAEEYILVRFHHGDSFIKAPNLKYVGEGEIKVTPIDKDHFSLVVLSCYAKDIGYAYVGGFYVFNSNFNEFVLLENDRQILNIVSHLKHGAFLDLFISHAVNRPILVEERVPFEFSSELGVVQNSENLINMGSRVALGEHPQFITQQTSVHPQLIARDAATDSYVTEQEETTDIRDENVNAKEDDSDLPSNLDSSEFELDVIPEEDDSELDEELRAFRTERRKKIHQTKKRKVHVPTPEVELGEAGADKGFDDIIRLNKRDKYAGRLGGDEECYSSSDIGSDNSRDELDVLAQRGIDLPTRRKSRKPRFDSDCQITIFELGMGLIPTIQELLPNAEHRRCARHIWSNWSINWKGEEIRKQFWRCAKASYEVKLKDELAKLAKLSKPNEDQEPENEIESWYRHEVFLKAYQYSIQPIPNMKMWPESNNPSIEPPEVKPMPGRPGKCKRKQKDEPRKKYGKLSKKGVKMTCSRCHQLGHNKSACKSVTEATSSQSSRPAQPMAPPLNRASQNMNPPSICTDTSAVKRSSQSQSTGRGRGRGRGYFATNATGRGRGRE
ncbi:hypothetical protein H5410_054860 [Solanum commersonii]|uniref:PB1-like domain-containing protein n=1 Tax=Solanum commersonii TaxID=4109 RepID=A0A9J5WIN9_SOLCO|nr:hypothetical protein H5410_054860 [Solanum commersonii]